VIDNRTARGELHLERDVVRDNVNNFSSRNARRIVQAERELLIFSMGDHLVQSSIGHRARSCAEHVWSFEKNWKCNI